MNSRMNILGRELRAIDITPFRDAKSYRIEVYQRDEREYCGKKAPIDRQQTCDGICKGLFMTTEAYDHGDHVDVKMGDTMMLVPPYGYINKGIFLSGFGLPDFDAFEKSLRQMQKDPIIQRVLRIEIETDGRKVLYKTGNKAAGFRRYNCGMENFFDFADSLPEYFDPPELAFANEAYETLNTIMMSGRQLEASKVDMSYDEKLAEAASIASMPNGWNLLHERFGNDFIGDVRFFMQNMKDGEKKIKAYSKQYSKFKFPSSIYIS